jgi:hypothetical protein
MFKYRRLVEIMEEEEHEQQRAESRLSRRESVFISSPGNVR